MSTELIGWIVDGTILASVVALAVRLEYFQSKRLARSAEQIRCEGENLHKATAEAVVSDTTDAVERLTYLIQNHISGPAHRR